MGAEVLTPFVRVAPRAAQRLAEGSLAPQHRRERSSPVAPLLALGGTVVTSDYTSTWS